MSKKRSKKQNKKQSRAERRAAAQRVRQKTGWQQAPTPSARDQRLYDDVAHVIFQDPKAARSPDAFAEALADLVADTDDLAGEPELQPVYFPPMEAATIYADIITARGLAAGMPENMSEDEQQDLVYEILEETAARLLSPELLADLIAAVEHLWQRAAQAGDRDLAGRAAALLLALEDPEAGESWASIGLVQVVAQRSVSAGFALSDAVEIFREHRIAAGDGEQEANRLIAEEAFATPEAEQVVQHVLDQFPGLDSYMGKQEARQWEEGLLSLFAGDIYLEFFSPEELLRGYVRATAEQPDDAARSETEEAHAFFSAIEAYLTELLTPERRERLIESAQTVFQDPEIDEESKSFLLMVLNELAELDQSTIRQLLVPTFVGELNVLSGLQPEE